MAMPMLASRPLLPIFNIPSYQPKLSSTWRIPTSLLTLKFLAIPLLTQLPRPSSILQDIWDGILKAVPKKKMSYSRSRSRRLAGKGLKDIVAIVKCPSCGRPKRSHFLCPYCVHAVQLFWKQAWKDLGLYKSAKTATTKALTQKDSEASQRNDRSQKEIAPATKEPDEKSSKKKSIWLPTLVPIPVSDVS